MLKFIKKSLTSLTNVIFVHLCSVLVRPHLEYAIQAKCPYLERIQKAATRWVKGLTYEERLKVLKR